MRRPLAWVMGLVGLAVFAWGAFQVYSFYYAGKGTELRLPVAAPSPTAPPVSAPPATAVPEAIAAVTALAPVVPASPPLGLELVRSNSGESVTFPLGSPMQTNANNEIIPDGLDAARWVNDPDMGAPGSDAERTVYIAGHTSPRRSAVFNPLYDRASGTSYVLPGDEFRVATEATAAQGLPPLRYVVEQVLDLPKGVVAEDAKSEVWRIVPGRLVIITCFQNPDGTPSKDNFVVIAQLAATA